MSTLILEPDITIVSSSNIFSHILLSINIRFLSEQYLNGTLFLKPASTQIPSPHSRRSSITRPERCAHPHRRDTRKWYDDYCTRTRTRTRKLIPETGTKIEHVLFVTKNRYQKNSVPKLHVRRARNRGTDYFGTGFRYRFLVHVSLALGLCINSLQKMWDFFVLKCSGALWPKF